ncbi:hypothetical protein SAMD00023378_3946 [Ralstonia sp. NT80]|uniref:hypothetical protein n=1 Tax=Ralstonia sp. NT80 TaxID=1218247 RepID=UPI00076F0541|nr:hypothetical protein [Ralstonia sp. NT80]GAQ30263.1 hypothetical protein SAMD00023378_3946 [Ralstonia sp. NT80]
MTEETSGRGDAESREPYLDPNDLVIWEELAQRSWLGPRMRLCIRHIPTGIEVRQTDLRLTAHHARARLVEELSRRVLERRIRDAAHSSSAFALLWQAAMDPTPRPQHYVSPSQQHALRMEEERAAAVLTLMQKGYTYAGGQLWKPPLGAPPAWTVYETQASRDVLAERRRQVEEEGWTCARDDDYNSAELAQAAAAYALHAGGQKSAAGITWPQSWAMDWFKPTTARRSLVKAGALILAEIERIDRAAAIAQRPVAYLTETPPCVGVARPMPPNEAEGDAK